MHRLPHLDAFLQLCLLQLNADPALQLIDAANRIEPEHSNRAAVRLAQSLDALHRRRFAGTIGSDQSEDLAVADLERCIGHSDRRTVRLANTGYLDDG